MQYASVVIVAHLVESLEDLIADARQVRKCVRPDGCDVCKAEARVAAIRACGLVLPNLRDQPK